LHVNEDEWNRDLIRENIQRMDIMAGWKELGMTRDDVGIIADVDETFSRDVLLAMQHCDDIATLDNDLYHCHYNSVRFTPAQVFESSLECITANRHWNRPNAILGRALKALPMKRCIHRHRAWHGWKSHSGPRLLPTIAIRRGNRPIFATAADRKRTWPNRGAVPSNVKRMRTPFTIKPGVRFLTCTAT
jgi:hypothetical protein